MPPRELALLEPGLGVALATAAAQSRDGREHLFPRASGTLSTGEERNPRERIRS